MHSGARARSPAGARARPNRTRRELPRPAVIHPRSVVASGAAAGPSAAAGDGLSSPSRSASLISRTKRLASDRRSLADFDKRIGEQKDLASIYARWSASVASRQRGVAHSVLLGVLVILSIGLV